MVPESYLRGQRERYLHLDPLSLDLASLLNKDPELKGELVALGLNIYPTEEDRTGPALLDALATGVTYLPQKNVEPSWGNPPVGPGS